MGWLKDKYLKVLVSVVALMVSMTSVFALDIDITSQGVLDKARQGGFTIAPEISELVIQDQLRTDATHDLGEYKVSSLAYGILLGWGSALTPWWSNSLSIRVDGLDSDYNGVKSKKSDFRVALEDLFLHQSHYLGAFLPYVGFGAEFLKLYGTSDAAGNLYDDGGTRISKLVYIPVGTMIQLRPSLGAQVQVNWAPYATSQLGDVQFKHDRKGFGFSLQLNWQAPFGLNQSVVLRPFFRTWHLSTGKPVDVSGLPGVDVDNFHRRSREYGMRLLFSF